MSLKKIVFGLVTVSMLSSITVSAATLYSATLTGTNAESNFTTLGSGTRYMKVSGEAGNGKASAMKIVKYAPDKVVGSTLSITAPNSSSTSFKADSYSSSGDVQSYYFRWKGSNSTAKASFSFTN
ncbi:hypothetical protein [Clostridium perfringens]|uniref:hypothetical protein n=1 Tax=Clostridium perfringens TaxID=1502 RepID=UPI002469A7B3|nr:hypothetical protein [Clostridium perfringens]MDH5079369.1 hypothetical protein [Clostridium perfringens]